MAANTEPGQDAFVASLKSELDAFRQFYQLLQAEQEALSQGDIDSLVKLAQVKSDKVVTLSQMADARNRYLVSHTFKPNQTGMEQWLQRYAPSGSSAAQAWKNLLDTAKSAERLNQENGALIETKLRHNQQALAILQSAANKTSLYGPDGQSYTPGGGRPLGKV